MVMVMVHVSHVMMVMYDCCVLKDLNWGRLMLVRWCSTTRVGGRSATSCSSYIDVYTVDFAAIVSCYLILIIYPSSC